MRSRSVGSLGLAIAVAFAVVAVVAVVMVPTPASAATYDTWVTCSAIDRCSIQSQTSPPSGAGKVTLVGGGQSGRQLFYVETQSGVTIERVEATYSNGTKKVNSPSSDGVYLYDDVTPTNFVTRFDVIWNDTNAGTTTSSSAPTSSTSSSSSSSSTSTSSSSSSTTSTSTSTPPTTSPYPGTVVNVRPDGDVRSSPDAAAVKGYEPVDVVVRGNDNAFWWTHWNGSSWSPWSGIGAPPVGADGDPTIASWGPGRLDVFVRGNDGKLWQTFSDDYGAHWNPWLKPVGDDGELVRWPEVSSRGPGLYDVFVLGTDGQIWQRFWDKDRWNDGWLSMGRPSVGIYGEPATVSQTWNNVDIFVWGSDDRLYQRSWTGETGWSEWFAPRSSDPTVARPRALMRSSPDAASWDGDTLLVFAKGADDHVNVLVHGPGGWAADWTRLGGDNAVIFNGPGATSRGFKRFDAFVRGTDNKLYQIYQ